MAGENTARDYANQLDQSRIESPGNFHVPQNGKAENYQSSIRNKAAEAEKYLPHELRERLEEARQKMHDAKQLGGQAKTLVKSMTPWGVFSLIGKIHPLTDIPYFFGIFAAILKDILDLVGIGSLPGVGTVITFLASIFISMMMLLGNISHSEHDRSIFQSIILKQVVVVLVVTVVELFFGLNFVPAQTIGAFIIYSFALAARKGRGAVASE